MRFRRSFLIIPRESADAEDESFSESADLEAAEADDEDEDVCTTRFLAESGLGC